MLSRITLLFLGVLLLYPVVLYADEESAPAEGGKPAATASGGKGATGAGGQAIYEKRCAHCHGIEGRGDGPAADFFRPQPANFVRADYKYASTPKGELPTDDDLFRTVSKGLPGTGMPAWESILSGDERKAVVAHIKTFSDRFLERKEEPKKIEFGKKVSSSKESIVKGKELFFKVECNRCHGDEGRADGKNAVDMPIWPRNLTKGWIFRRGNTPEEIFQRITRGIGKKDMPSFAKGENVETTEEERWHIANYVESISEFEDAPEPAETIFAQKVTTLPDTPDDPAWVKMDRYYFPLVGQVTIEPRMFTPTVDSVIAKAAYTDKEVAILLIWDDPTKSLISGGAEGDDAIAMQFPSEIRDERPYFIMGDPSYPVYVVRLNAGAESVEELTATGQEHAVGIRFAPQGSESQQFSGKVLFKDGRYRAILKRALATPDKADLQFAPMQFIPIAFSVWDGGNGEVDSKRSISAWYYILLKPPDPPTRYIYPTVFAVVIVGIQWWVSRRYGKGSKPKDGV
jgi:DMSO reductase family type II enzyme heme b subunit